jgi:uncharacterized protein YabN with tetrapyrrole methylase and pyrophosphatase domain
LVAAEDSDDDTHLDDAYAHLEEELGDLLYQVFFHAVLAAENGRFTIADVARGIYDKLERRHPHVFGDLDAATSEEVMSNWEQIKKAEKGRTSVMDGIPVALPALAYAAKVLGKAGDSDVAPPAAAENGHDGADAADRVGTELFALVARARAAGVDPEAALRRTAAAYVERFRAQER